MLSGVHSDNKQKVVTLFLLFVFTFKLNKLFANNKLWVWVVRYLYFRTTSNICLAVSSGLCSNAFNRAFFAFWVLLASCCLIMHPSTSRPKNRPKMALYSFLWVSLRKWLGRMASAAPLKIKRCASFQTMPN